MWRCVKADIGIGWELGLNLGKVCHEEGELWNIRAPCGLCMPEGTSRVLSSSLISVFPRLPSKLFPVIIASVGLEELLNVV